MSGLPPYASRRIDRTGGCWRWTGAGNQYGYGLATRPRDAAMSRLFRLLGWLAVVIVGGYALVAWVVGCVA